MRNRRGTARVPDRDRALPCDIEGFQVMASGQDVVIRKRAASVGELCFLLPATVVTFLMGVGTAVCAVIGVLSTIRGSSHPWWAGLLMACVLVLGAGICGWGFQRLLLVMLPVTRRLVSCEGFAVCELSVKGVSLRRVSLKYPLQLDARPYSSRGDWLCDFSIRDAAGRRFKLMIPTVISGSRSGAQSIVRPCAEAIASCIGARVIGLDEPPAQAGRKSG